MNGTPAQHRPAQPQETYRQETPQYRPEPVSPVSSRHSRGDSGRVSNEWAPSYYAGQADAPQAPTSAPPPPPRPPKSDEGQEEPRYGRERERERDGKRESARHRLMGTLAR